MNLYLFKTLWGHRGSIDDAIEGACRHGFDGLEGQVPSGNKDRESFKRKVTDAGLRFIAEIYTAGNYVPDRKATPADHLASLRCQMEPSMECDPLFLTVIAGCDAWPVSESVEFFGRALATADEFNAMISFETHRSRSFFNPWVTQEIVRQLPGLKLTCDFSHWCAVGERLVMDTEPDILAFCAERAHHVHARVGYDQGPQVPHPAAPEYHAATEAHERWWMQIWQSQSRRGMPFATMTPEFGPDGYLQCQPFTRQPMADLEEINGWMALRLRRLFEQVMAGQAEPLESARTA